MKTILKLIAVMIIAATCAWGQTAPDNVASEIPIIGLFPTGYGDKGLLPVGSADQHYKLDGGVAFVATPAVPWLHSASARWLCPTANGNAAVAALPRYDYATTFVLPKDAALESVSLTISAAVDDGVIVWLNGKDTQLPTVQKGFGEFNTFRVTGKGSPFFVTGTNLLVFLVNNAPEHISTPTPSGLIVGAISGTFRLSTSTVAKNASLVRPIGGSGKEAISTASINAVRIADNADNYLTNAMLKELKLDCDGAIADCNRAIELKPNSAQAYFERAESYVIRDLKNYHTNNDSDMAISDYSKAIELKPDFVEAYCSRGGVKRDDKRDFDGAISDYTKAIEIKPDYANAYYGRGLTKAAKRDRDFFDSSSLSDINHIHTLSKGEKEANEEIIVDFSKYIELEPNSDSSAYTYRGWSHLNLGEYDMATADYTKANELKPDNSYAKMMLDVVKDTRLRGLINTNSITLKKPSSEEILSITNLQGKIYENIRIVKDVPDGIFFLYAGTNIAGGGKILFEDMPESWQSIYNYSPSMAAQYQQDVSDEKASYMAQYAAAGQASASASASAAQNAAVDKTSSSGDILVSGFSTKVTEKNSTYWL